MTTTQKTISMRLITFGLFVSLVFLGASCKKNTSWIMQGDFYFINETDYPITYAMSGFEKFNIAPKSSILIKVTQDSGEDVKPFYYHSPFIEEGIKKSFVVKFDANKCWETVGNKHSPLNIEDYSPEQTGERSYKFTYTFTEADYGQAKDCL